MIWLSPINKQKPDGSYSDEETARPRDEVVKRMLNSPRQPRKAGGGGRNALPDHFYVFLDGRLFVAVGKKPPGPAFTADLYKNLDDLRAGHVAESGVELEIEGD